MPALLIRMSTFFSSFPICLQNSLTLAKEARSHFFTVMFGKPISSAAASAASRFLKCPAGIIISPPGLCPVLPAGHDHLRSSLSETPDGLLTNAGVGSRHYGHAAGEVDLWELVVSLPALSPVPQSFQAFLHLGNISPQNCNFSLLNYFP